MIDFNDATYGVPHHEIRHFRHHDAEDDCLITIMSRGKRIYVDISPKDLGEHEHEYARLINALREDEGFVLGDDAAFNEGDTTFNKEETAPNKTDTAIYEGDTVIDENVSDTGFNNDAFEDFAEWACGPFLPILASLAPKLPDKLLSATVADSFDPPTVYFDLKSVDGILTPVQKRTARDDPGSLIPRVKINSSLLRPELPLVPPKSLKIEWDPRKELWPHPTRVSHNMTDFLFLKQAIQDTEESAEREIEILLRLKDLGISDTLRIPKLYGYVQYEEETHISGLLLTYVESRDTLGGLLYEGECTMARKQNWMEQIETILEAPHKVGIVWGDAKTDNILIDLEDNAWMIDFGGSFTPGWVDQDLKETVQGDLQGLQKIRERLHLAS